MRTIFEVERGCGYRKPGGLYLVSPPGGVGCALLPFPLHVCRVCGGGIKPARAWTWVLPDDLLGDILQPHGEPGCPLTGVRRLGAGDDENRCGLIWVGEAFYTPASFLSEAKRLGVSRRLPAVPRGFRAGATWVLMAHRQAVPGVFGMRDGQHVPIEDPADAPGIFAVWRPEAWEYVVHGDETDETLEALVKRGIEPVRVERAGQEAL
jgi:hypothetical protein